MQASLQLPLLKQQLQASLQLLLYTIFKTNSKINNNSWRGLR